jgi:hypothetical protein
LFQAYIDGELGQADKLILEKHLSGCSTCVKVLEQQKSSSAMLFEAFLQKRLSHDLRDMVIAHLPEMEDFAAPATLPAMKTHSNVRTVAEVNWRAKHPRTRLFRTLFPVLAASVLLVFSLAVIVASWPERGIEDNIVGMVTFTGGDSLSNENDSVNRKVVQLEGMIEVGERFETRDEGSLMLSLAGASHVKVAEKTRVKILTDREISVEQGKVWLDVGKDDRLFKVTTPFGKVIVFGTVFEVVVTSSGTTVTVEEGDVHVENESGAFSDLLTGEQVEVHHDQKQLVPHAVDTESLLAWARAIKADRSAEKLYLAKIRPRKPKIMQAEEMFRIVTDGQLVEQITLNWKQDGFYTTGHCGYQVNVYDEEMNLLFKKYIGPSIFDRNDISQHTIELTGQNVITNKSHLLMKILPDDEGHIKTEFQNVYASAM